MLYSLGITPYILTNPKNAGSMAAIIFITRRCFLMAAKKLLFIVGDYVEDYESQMVRVMKT